MTDKNVTNEVLDSIIDSMPEPSAAAESILQSESVAEPEPEPSGVRSAVSPSPNATIPPVEWLSESDVKSNENQPQSVEAKRVDPEATDSGELFDNAGVRFDPRYHCTDEGGIPRKTKAGKWRKRKGVIPPAPTVDANAMLAAALAVTTSVELLGACIGGDEWKPEQSEHEMMVNAWRDYFMVSGAINIPPYLGVIIATSAYALPRLSKPVTASRLERIWGWVKRGFSWIF